jgi:hypothetical protein
MGCCGKKRNLLKVTPSPAGGPTPRADRAARRGATASVSDSASTTFRYVGTTALTVRGPVTGRTYRFAKGGASVVVDERDAPYLRVVPNLRPTLPAA